MQFLIKNWVVFLALAVSFQSFSEEDSDTKSDTGSDSQMSLTDVKVRMSGSFYSKRLYLINNDKTKKPRQHRVCKDDENYSKLRKLSGYSVDALGKLTKPEGKKKSCFVVDGFDIIKTSAGRKAYVGTLAKDGEHYVLTLDDNSKKIKLDKFPDSIKSEVGKKVIMDLKSIPVAQKASGSSMSGGQGNGWRVVTFSKFPNK